jgi:hypothetical protein
VRSDRGDGFVGRFRRWERRSRHRDLLEAARLETSEQSDFRLTWRTAREMDFDGARLGFAQGSRVVCSGYPGSQTGRPSRSQVVAQERREHLLEDFFAVPVGQITPP